MKEVELTQGPILKTLIKLSVPIMASSFLGTLYNITDMAWIGLLGTNAVAGVGVGGMFVWFSQGLGLLARMGGQVHVAQCIGQKKMEEAKNYATTAIQISIILGLLFCFVSILLAKPLVGMFHLDNAESIQDAIVYTRIVCGTIVFAFLNVTFTGLFTAKGDSKTPFLANLIGLCANMILDPVLILGPGPFVKLGVYGASIATAFSQFIVCVVFVAAILFSKREQTLFKNMKWLGPVKLKYANGIVKIGGPSAVQSMVYCMISMVLTRLVSGFGSAAVSAQRVGGQIESISWNTADGFGASLNAFVGQNYGAGQKTRVKRGYRISFALLLVWGILISLLFILLPEPISKIFFHEAEAIKASTEYFWVIGFSEVFLCIELMTIGALSGLGETRLCSMISIVLTSIRIPLAYILSAGSLGVLGVWWALTISSMLKGIVFTLVWQRKMQK